MPTNLQELYPKLINLLLDTVFVVDSDNIIVYVSDGCETLLGYRAEELVGTAIINYVHPEDLAATRSSIVRVMNGQPHVDFRNRYIRKDGAIVYILWSARWSDEDAVRIGVARDVTKLEQVESKLHYMAHHDPLTGLANRALFNDRLDTALRSARRHQNNLALLFIDLNDFKDINDVYGHVMGDRVLCTIAARLKTLVRETDTVARIGGDEFTVLLTDIQSEHSVVHKVAQIMAIMAEPLGPDFNGLKLPSCSIGVACYPEDGDSAEQLMSYADGDMYHAKKTRAAMRR
ncbi:MAG: putative signaling protein [Pseudidiomarina mangrovi]|nr:MAG: putative signaling protein [Pseudidiomarina mangrovi]